MATVTQCDICRKESSRKYFYYESGYKIEIIVSNEEEAYINVCSSCITKLTKQTADRHKGVTKKNNA